MFSLNENRIKDLDNSTHLHSVPLNIADDMVDLLDSIDFFNEPSLDMTAEDYVNSHRVIDISCKSGSLLFSFYKRFMIALRNVFPDRDDRELFIMRYLLYGLCPDKRYLDLVRNTFYSNQKYDLTNEFGNFYHYNFEDQRGVDKEEVKELLENMRFDVVCGNPPYNDDMYLDFVRLGHKLAKSYGLWITPAKWQAKMDNDSKEFRDCIVPYMKKIVVYKTSTDVFDITAPDGISYYLIGKEISKHYVKCVSNTSSVFSSSFELHSEKSLTLVPQRVLDIINKLGFSLCDKLDFKQSKYIKNTSTGYSCRHNTTDLEVLQGDSVCGYLPIDEALSTDRINYYKCYTNIMPGVGVVYLDKNGTSLGLNKVNKALPNQVPKGSYPCLAYFKTEQEANGFLSFCDTKLVKFAHLVGICGTTITSEFWRFVPDPGSFDKVYEDKPLEGYTPDENGIYTDNNGVVHCSLYVKYKLTDEEINVIESVIRERK